MPLIVDGWTKSVKSGVSLNPRVAAWQFISLAGTFCQLLGSELNPVIIPSRSELRKDCPWVLLLRISKIIIRAKFLIKTIKLSFSRFPSTLRLN